MCDDTFLELEEDKESQEENDAVYNIKPMGFASFLHKEVVVCTTIYTFQSLEKDKSGESKVSDGSRDLFVMFCLILSIK